MGSRKNICGFTLVELMVVIVILVLLLTILGPAVTGAYISGLRGRCKANLRELARGCRNYGHDTRLHREGPLNALPYTEGLSGDNWGHLEEGNSAALWLLIEHGYAGRAMLYCPEAGMRRGFDKPADDANHFTDKTASYSYLSMVLRAFIPRLHRDKPSLIIIGDQNPRCTLGVTRTSQGAPGPNANEGNSSANHAGEGQAVVCLDTSTQWLDSPAGGGDDIYAATGDETNGERGSRDDIFLIP